MQSEHVTSRARTDLKILACPDKRVRDFLGKPSRELRKFYLTVSCSSCNKKDKLSVFEIVKQSKNTRFCHSCNAFNKNMLTVPLPVPSFILIDKTIKKFGYDPRYLKQFSELKVCVKCNICGFEYEMKKSDAQRVTGKYCRGCYNTEVRRGIQKGLWEKRRAEILKKNSGKPTRDDVRILAWLFWSGNFSNRGSVLFQISYLDDSKFIESKEINRLRALYLSQEVQKIQGISTNYKLRNWSDPSTKKKRKSHSWRFGIMRNKALILLSRLGGYEEIKGISSLRSKEKILEFMLKQPKNFIWIFLNELMVLGSIDKIANGVNSGKDYTVSGHKNRSFHFRYIKTPNNSKILQMLKNLCEKMGGIEVTTSVNFGNNTVFFTLKKGVLMVQDKMWQKISTNRKDEWKRIGV